MTTRYGHRHRRIRASWAAAVASGKATCARCGKPITPDQPWDLGHQDGAGPNDYTGPEHATCNRAAPGKRWDPPAAPVTRW